MAGQIRELPKVSVVTINLNMRDDLEATIKSVIGQTYSNLEYLVIDGASTDGSVEVIRGHANRIHRWVSEPDLGLYDAMNKGTREASGEWVIFMNAGDEFYDSSAIADVFREIHSDADLIYGHSVRRYAREKVERVVRAELPGVLGLRMNCSHQSLFSRRSILMERPFSVGLMAADYEFLVRMHVEGKRFKMVDRVVGININGGISDRKRLRSLSERGRIATRYGLMTPLGALSYAGMASRAVIGPYIKFVLPRPVTGWLLRHKKFD